MKVTNVADVQEIIERNFQQERLLVAQRMNFAICFHKLVDLCFVFFDAVVIDISIDTLGFITYISLGELSFLVMKLLPLNPPECIFFLVFMYHYGFIYL